MAFVIVVYYSIWYNKHGFIATKQIQQSLFTFAGNETIFAIITNGCIKNNNNACVCL